MEAQKEEKQGQTNTFIAREQVWASRLRPARVYKLSVQTKSHIKHQKKRHLCLPVSLCNNQASVYSSLPNWSPKMKIKLIMYAGDTGEDIWIKM